MYKIILVVIRLCPETRSKLRSYKSLEREVMCKQERIIVTILSCESEGRIARDLNRERGRLVVGISKFCDEVQSLELVQAYGQPGARQPLPLPAIQAELNAQLFLTDLLTHSDGMQYIWQTSHI